MDLVLVNMEVVVLHSGLEGEKISQARIRILGGEARQGKLTKTH